MSAETSNTHAALRPLASLAYALGKPDNGAVIKHEFVDFKVDEELAFEPTGSGEHVFVRVRKTDSSTIDVAKRLAEVTAAKLSDVGFSGMKDRRGETSQWFSVKLAQESEHRLADLEDDKICILSTARNSRKLKIGSHARNHFRLRLRNCEGEPADFERRLQSISTQGVPNYFGSQRFGAQMSNLKQVSTLMQSVLAGGSADARKLPRFKRGLLFSAARAYLFNQVLSERIRADSWARYLEGDVLSLDGSGRCFVLRPDEEWGGELQERLQCMDIHPTGPLPGLIGAKDKYVSIAQAADIEEVVLKEFDYLVQGLKAFGLHYARRPLRFAVTDMHWHWEPSCVESHTQNDLCLEFILPRGAYATSLLREICQLHES